MHMFSYYSSKCRNLNWGTTFIHLSVVFFCFTRCWQHGTAAAPASCWFLDTAVVPSCQMCCFRLLSCSRCTEMHLHHHSCNAAIQRSHPPSEGATRAIPLTSAWTMPAAPVCSTSCRHEDKNCPQKTLQRLLFRPPPWKAVCFLQIPPQTQAAAGVNELRL